MNKLTKYQQERLASMPTLEDVECEFFTKHPEEFHSYRKVILDEYKHDPSMNIQEPLCILSHIDKLERSVKPNLSRPHVYRFRSNSNPTLSTLSKLADSWGMRVGLFFK
ncbi:MAG: hypothetical protein IJ876_05075 [Elusimicrobiaceae bacterium]|nr:hypothetical protein [Elusimicrobiaceae bacterium]